MTLKEFLALDYYGRMAATMRGVCVAGRNFDPYKVLLYQLNAFYVEVYYNKNHHFISEINGFDSTEQLEPYLAKIAIPV